MRVVDLKINHLHRPLGYWFKNVTASFRIVEAEGKHLSRGRILVALDREFCQIVYDTGMIRKISPCATRLKPKLQPCTRYYWKVQVWDEEMRNAESEPEWFETALLSQRFAGIPITPEEHKYAPVFIRKFTLEKKPERARLYMVCLGAYEAYLNGKRIGDELLNPGLTVFDQYVPYQTYDVGDYLQEGCNMLEVSAGSGWYMGKYGYRQNGSYGEGKEFVLIGELHGDGNCLVKTDLEWRVRRNKILSSDIYDGEIYDAGLDDTKLYSVKRSCFDTSVLRERLNAPVRCREIIKPVGFIHTPKGELVLDMGQNMVGCVRYFCREMKGARILFEHGEILQDGCFYRENYRTAKAQYLYISNGEEQWAGAKLTFFGFRYVRISGLTVENVEDFWGEVWYTDLESITEFDSDYRKLDRLMENILWSQKGNFLDVPTDCPQRDEKMGWTGDAQIFCSTACRNMECYSFFRKYLNDIILEQKTTGGLVPQIVPSVGRNERTSAAWGDAAVVIPWKLYLNYGDPSILEEQYESMKGWIAYIDSENRKKGTDEKLWQNGFHYGDWLALDGGCYHMPTGGTPIYFVSSAWFYHSTKILAETAGLLGRPEAESYCRKAEQIKEAIQREYFTGSGRLAVNTQTAYVLALVFGLAREKEKQQLEKDFLDRLRLDGYQVKTGFSGTPFLLEALSICGRDDIAYRILLDERFPGWLYPVTMGATSMWERWDAVLPDGSMSDSGMNSLNHYANGAVGEWIYSHVCGLSPLTPGYGRVRIAPSVNRRLHRVNYMFKSSFGVYHVSWEFEDNGMRICMEIPFNASAEVRLPYVEREIFCNGELWNKGSSFELETGRFVFTYSVSAESHLYYSLQDSVEELVRNVQVRDYLYKKIPVLEKVHGAQIQRMTLPEMGRLPFFLGIGTRLGISAEILQEISGFLKTVEKQETEHDSKNMRL